MRSEDPTGPAITEVDVAFVIGPMRTATTFVSRTLDTHPQVAYLGFELAEEWSAWTGLPIGAPGAGHVVCPELGSNDATPAVIEGAREGLRRRLATHLAETGPRPALVVLKNPHFWNKLPLLLEVLPHARLVRTGRELRSTVASLQRLWQRSVDQHGRVHHLPEDPTRCWDYVPAGDRDRYDPTRTFPGGDVAVLVEFLERVEAGLDAFADAHPGRVVMDVTQEELVEDFDATTRRLQRAVGLEPVPLHPPHPLDPDRLDEWQELLDDEEQRRIARAREAWRDRRPASAP